MITCHICRKKGYFCYTPYGGEYISCPICNYGEYNDLDDDDIYYEYCEKCGTVYDISHMHCILGCTDNVYHALLIKDQDGNPMKFSSREECVKEMKTKKYQFLCTCEINGDICEKEYPRYAESRKSDAKCKAKKF